MNCFYCNKQLFPLKSSYGYWYKCNDCDASVGCHAGTQKPLGTTAKPELRALRKEAHRYFDATWRAKMKRDGCGQQEARSAGYKWLQQQLNLSAKECHIGKFNEAQCKQVIELCKPAFKKV